MQKCLEQAGLVPLLQGLSLLAATLYAMHFAPSLAVMRLQLAGPPTQPAAH